MAGKQQHAWDPVYLEVHEVSAIKALAHAHPEAFKLIIHKICRVGELSFAAGGEDGRRETDYAEGKRAIGVNLLNIVAMKMPAPKQQGEGPHAVPKGEPPQS